MPSVSDKQRKAMAAAAAGKSTIGIPQKVGKKFARADRKKTSASNQGGASVGG